MKTSISQRTKGSLLAPLFRGSFYHYPDDPEHNQIRHSLVRTPSNPVSAISELKKNFFLFSIRGWDNFHVYLWILKDYAWSSGNDALAYFFGVATLSWCGVLAIVAISSDDWEELYFLFAMFGWLFANFWWMAAETGIVAQDDDESALQSSYMMEASLSWLLLYFLYLLPQKVFADNPEQTKLYEDAGLVPRFAYFKSWRQYEYVHMLCWLCKDFAWNRHQQEMYVIALIPTILIGVDFIHESYRNNYVVDNAHYSAQLMWVFANAAWSIGELFFPAYDDAIPVTDVSRESLHTGRWWASMLLLLAFIPIGLLYFVWLPWVLYHALVERQEKMEQVLDEYAARQHNAEFNPALSLSGDGIEETRASRGSLQSPYQALVAAALSDAESVNSRNYNYAPPQEAEEPASVSMSSILEGDEDVTTVTEGEDETVASSATQVRQNKENEKKAKAALKAYLADQGDAAKGEEGAPLNSIP